jgi:hypothetical protein
MSPRRHRRGAHAVATMQPTDPPSRLILVLLKGTVLLPTVAEYRAGILRGRWWRRRDALAQRDASSPPPDFNAPQRL